MLRRGLIAAAGGLGAGWMAGWKNKSVPAVDRRERAAADSASRLSRLLLAREPDHEHVKELMLFGQFAGSWDFELVELTAQGEVATSGEWHFGWILRGLGVQDVWIVPRRDAPPDPRGVAEYGTTIRIYDPNAGSWQVSWNGPVRSRFVQLEGGRDDDDIVLTGMIGSQPTRWIFSNIKTSSFDWRNELSFDGGQSFLIVQQLTARRTR